MNQGAISRAIAWLLGANWRSSLSGYISIVALMIHEKPEWIQWIPEPTRGFIWSVSEYIFVGGFAVMVNRVKDKNITGGDTQQTYTGNLTEPGKQDLVDVTLKASSAEEKAAVTKENKP